MNKIVLKKELFICKRISLIYIINYDLYYEKSNIFSIGLIFLGMCLLLEEN